MRIGVIGASGFIGSHFCRLAQGSGHEVIAYTRRQGVFHPFATETLHQSSSEPGTLPETRLDAMVHLAGESVFGLWTQNKRDRILRSRSDLTRRIVESMATWSPQNRPAAFICASGVGFYGSRGDEVLDEGSSRGDGFLAEVCLAWEEAARTANQAFGARVVSLRTGLVLGSDGGALPLMKLAFKLGLGGRLGSGSQWTPWIHIADEAALILWAVEQDAVHGPLNLSAPHPVTNAEFTRVLARAVHRPAVLPAPAFALRLVLRDMADEMLLVSQRAVPRAAVDRGFTFAHSTLDSALQDLLG